MPTVHTERCAECKHVVFRMLEHGYDKVMPDPKVVAPVQLDALLVSRGCAKLGKVHEALQAHRGHTNLTRQRTLPRCDYLVTHSATSFVVELDESQHFTAARAVSLKHYPSNLPLGFDRKRWRRLCKSINAHDNHPEDRDERRAWYDSIRDFLPLINGYAPTVRVFMKHTQWCGLSPSSAADRKRFAQLLRESAFGTINAGEVHA